MRNLLRQSFIPLMVNNLIRPEEQLFHKRLPKKLEFGHTLVAQYKKHIGGMVKSIFWNPNTKAYVSYNEKNLHVWKPETEEQIFYVNFFDETKSHQISCIVYSSKYHVRNLKPKFLQLYLAISNDFKLHIFNEHLHHIKALPLKIRLINFAYFYEKESKLITAGIDGCFMFEFKMECKYEPKQAVLLDPEGNTMEFKLGPKIKLEKMPLWVKGLKVDEVEGIIFTWSQLKTCFNDISTGKLQFKFKSLTTYEDYITDLILSDEFRYFITSTYFGHIFVWKLTIHRKLIHSYGGHTKTVTSLSNHPTQPTLFISASNDNTIRIWCLDKFSELYCFELQAGINNIKMMNERIFACFYNDAIKIGELHHLALSFTNQGSAISKIGKCFNEEQDIKTNDPFAVFTLFKDNSALIQNPNTGKTLSTIYPPPTAKEVMFISYCMTLKRMFILLTSGTLCIYKIDRDTAILEKLQYPNQLKDSEGKSVTQQITSMTFASSVPPKYDCEIFNEVNVNNKMQEEEKSSMKNQYVDYTDKFLVFGLSKGTIVFISVDNLELIHARFSIHRQAVEQIYEIKPIGDIKICNNLIFVGFKTGDTEMFLWDEEHKEKEFYRLNCDKIDEHEDELQSLDFLPKFLGSEIQSQNKKYNTGLFVTGAKDGLVKVWNVKKELIREIKFPEPITSVCFLNSSADLLVGHVSKVSTVLAKDYKPFEIMETALPTEYEIEKFSMQRTVVTEKIFQKLKRQDDKIKKQYQELTKKSPLKISNNQFHQDVPNASSPFAGDEKNDKSQSPENSFSNKKKHPKFKDDTIISEIRAGDPNYENQSPRGKSTYRRDESDSDNDNMFDEDIYQKALEAAKIEQEKRAQKRMIAMQKRSLNDPIQQQQHGQMLKKKKTAITTIKRVEYQNFQNQQSYQTDNKVNQSSYQNYPYGGSPNGNGPNGEGKIGELTHKESIHEFLEKYKPGKVTALPPMMNHQVSQLTLLRQLQSKTNMTRRDITEGRIIQNILLHNDPREQQVHDDIYISTRGDKDLFGSQSFIYKTVHNPNKQPQTIQQQYQMNSVSIISSGQKNHTSSAKNKRSNTHSLPRINTQGRNAQIMAEATTKNSLLETKNHHMIQYQSIQLSNNSNNPGGALYGLAQSQNSYQNYLTTQDQKSIDQMSLNQLMVPTAPDTLPTGYTSRQQILKSNEKSSNLKKSLHLKK
ncbi:wd repeat-containing protein 87 [Stylonychia lemnae]|uniref:Wd repeat-containing protein 87 n=1 Tax=Stylonychia lemnae TaxID=5949 RepID=A0A078A870_STYLE|nr:wd repeat-containing protein 87 [Stylonychia lemnae]|eukprot:CDW78455.1 wd repeat-containing protein 87 [Stylonychia lemnae]